MIFLQNRWWLGTPWVRRSNHNLGRTIVRQTINISTWFFSLYYIPTEDNKYFRVFCWYVYVCSAAGVFRCTPAVIIYKHTNIRLTYHLLPQIKLWYFTSQSLFFLVRLVFKFTERRYENNFNTSSLSSYDMYYIVHDYNTLGTIMLGCQNICIECNVFHPSSRDGALAQIWIMYQLYCKRSCR